MKNQDFADIPVVKKITGSKVKTIKQLPNEDVYCLGTKKNGNFIANGIIIKNCDALRYCLYTAFGKRQELKEYSKEERHRMAEQKKWAKNPMAYPGFVGSHGWQTIGGSAFD